MFVVQFAVISNIIHRHPEAMMHREGTTSLLVCARFCMEFAGSVESLELHEPTK